MSASPATIAATTRRILCGHCKNYHPTVAAVRACATSGTQIIVNRPEATQPLPTGGPLATARQINFLRALCEERDTTLEHEADVTTLTMPAASALITELKARPKATAQVPEITKLVTSREVVELPDVPAGRYAITEDGEYRFYRVDRPTEGRWAGRTFLKVQASGEFYNVRETGRVLRVLRAIAQDPRGASLTYGREIGECGVCGRTLTDATSRERGIGPICADKAGW